VAGASETAPATSTAQCAVGSVSRAESNIVNRPLTASAGYAVALAAVGAALVSALLLRDVLEPGVFPLFLVAVTVSALYGGVGPALLATVLSLLASYYVFLAPLYSFAFDQSGLSRLLFFRMGTFTAAALLIIAMATARTRAIATARRARAETEEAHRRMAFLAEASEVLGASLDYDETLTSLVRLAVAFLADWCSVDMREPDGSMRRIAVSHADPAKAELVKLAMTYPPDPVGRHPRTIALRTGRSQLVPEIREEDLATVAGGEEQLAVMRQLAYRSAMVVPLVARGETLGVLTFAITESDRRYDAADLALAEDLARRCALAVDNARLYGAAQEANRTKDRFLATLSHELRSPLNAVVTWVHLLRSGRLDEARTRRALATIESSARLQVRLIEDLLDVARIASGKLHLEPGSVDLRATIEVSVDVVRAAADEKRITLDVVADVDCQVPGDATRLQQVFGNLFGNAVKFTPEGGTVAIGLTCGDGEATVVVEDSGVGIPPDELPRIFEPFQQVGTASARKAGLGLGLAISSHLVELHHGTIRAHSAGVGRGARFTITLPLDVAEVNATPDVASAR
jgi:signal transduction histidine kinase